MVVCPQPLQCQVLQGLTLGLRRGWTCSCTVMMSVDKTKMLYNFSHFNSQKSSHTGNKHLIRQLQRGLKLIRLFYEEPTQRRRQGSSVNRATRIQAE